MRDILRPMLASLADAPLVDAGLVYEPKYDGIRAIVEITPPRGGAASKRSATHDVRLWSRLGNEKTKQFPEIAAALAAWARQRRIKHELVLAIVGGLFVLETVSVILQVASFKLTGKRIFRMAPLHHHFEKKGWAEPTVVIRFWIIAFVLGLLGLATLKIR